MYNYLKLPFCVSLSLLLFLFSLLYFRFWSFWCCLLFCGILYLFFDVHSITQKVCTVRTIYLFISHIHYHYVIVGWVLMVISVHFSIVEGYSGLCWVWRTRSPISCFVFRFNYHFITAHNSTGITLDSFTMLLETTNYKYTVGAITSLLHLISFISTSFA